MSQHHTPFFQSVSHAASHCPPDTPIASRISSTLETSSFFLMGTSALKPYMMMEDWMAGGKGREESIAITPDVINTKAKRNKPLPTVKEPEAGTSEHVEATPSQAASAASDHMKTVSHGQDLAAADSSKLTLPDKIITPTLSEFTTNLFIQSDREKGACGASQLEGHAGAQTDPKLTEIPNIEEPVLLSQQNPLLYPSEEQGAPEEPVLHYKENLPLGMMQQQPQSLEEPVLTYRENLPYRIRGPTSDTDIPKEPILFYQQRTPRALLARSTLRQAKDPLPLKLPMTSLDDSIDVPKTPELSDMTRSILSLVGNQAPPQPHRDHHSHSQHHRDNHGPTHHHRDHKGTTQPHDDAHHHARPTTHTHKPGQSFSAAMNQLSRTGEDENAWGGKGGRGAQQQWSSASVSQREKVAWDKFPAGLDQYQSAVPPSPQLSDITQRILGQMRR